MTTTWNGSPPFVATSSQELQMKRPNTSYEKLVCWMSTMGEPGKSVRRAIERLHWGWRLAPPAVEVHSRWDNRRTWIQGSTRSGRPSGFPDLYGTAGSCNESNQQWW